MSSNPLSTPKGCQAGSVFLGRREFLRRSGGGFGALALAHLLQSDTLGAVMPTVKDSARLPHQKPRAKNVIFLFMEGGPSHLDTFDPKPLLNTLAASASLPASSG
jgi:hypothetical protein